MAILTLPFVMTVVIPWWLLRRTIPGGNTALEIAGAIVFAAGFSLFAWCVSLFATRGKGTLAPWDPPRHLVVTGPYRFMRNPMLTGVLTMIAGEALYTQSRRVAAWTVCFFVINQTYFLLLEEPGLARRFGDEYTEYRANVPRWLPRLSPWRGRII